MVIKHASYKLCIYKDFYSLLKLTENKKNIRVPPLSIAERETWEDS